ncbi:Wzz/FepE/Etk N-terminal domain-containing protein [Pelomonas sp. UHG3]|uniref:Wzz/FepE/Etk N-terminal domain-containing protein n=1 Tax=Roseateles hydrophilus TaxID=2975054 RepID=A0ACC6CEU4_9BURK|nr:Wzz/FepE/Etk N-terminal domain-containing protein [Pelomonas sp. UHG3]MCY4746799.1 Wzz/FepE/Etk N-terminal domain-containing protein [Pelomonas sp. UHG3]
MENSLSHAGQNRNAEGKNGISLPTMLAIYAKRWKLLIAGSIAAGIVGYAGSYLIPPTFTSRTLFLPPQQSQTGAASALANLGALSGLSAAGLGAKNTGDQYVSLLQSANIQDQLIDQFKLMSEYDTEFRMVARKELSQNVRITLGKKDGLISIEADASSPKLAADLANAHIAELRRLTSQLALTEAQQRRVFFETELKRTRDRLAEAQLALQESGFNPGALKAEPKAAAESYARLRAEVTAAEIRLHSARRMLADNAPEVQQQAAILGALRAQLSKLEASAHGEPTDGGYVKRYRDFKYQETLFELFSRQYESARLDESREGGLIQVVDTATPPERKSKPRRAVFAVGAMAIGFAGLTFWILSGVLRDRRTS